MNQHEWVTSVEEWFASLPGGDLAAERRAAWNRFAESPRPVVTIVGSYDTGKSSLLRRLLVDDGEDVPEWLTISAKPETDSTSEVVTLGCLVRDTPGISSRPGTDRAKLHNAESYAALGLTDAAVLLLNPQLATDELGSLRAIVDGAWPSGALIVVVGRFDEAGCSPEDDPDGYQRLIERKESELRKLLELDVEVPALFVSQDPNQEAGDDRQPDPRVWDEYRAWDGMDAVAEALRAIGRNGPDAYRRSAQQRFWAASLLETCDALRVQASEQASVAELVSQVRQRRESWLDQLQVLDESAMTAAHAEIQEAVRAALGTREPDASVVKDQMKVALNIWWRRNVSALIELQRDINEAIDRQHQRPAWEFLDSLLIQMDEPTTGTSGTEKIAPKVIPVANNLIKALRKYHETANKSPLEFSRGQSAAGNSQAPRPPQKTRNRPGKPGKIDVVAALEAAPVAVDAVAEIVSLLGEMRRSRAVDQARVDHAARIEEEAGRLASMAVHDAEPAWKELVGQTRREIETATQEAFTMGAALDVLIPQLQVAIQAGDALQEEGDELQPAEF